MFAFLATSLPHSLFLQPSVATYRFEILIC